MYDTLNHGISYWDHVVPAAVENRPAMVHKLNDRAMELWPGIFKVSCPRLPGCIRNIIRIKNRRLQARHRHGIRGEVPWITV